jgi:two-component system nitrogen regulation sensor histidine kinase NtrY
MSEASGPARRAPSPEARRRRREVVFILLAALAVVLFVLFEARAPRFERSGSVGTDVILVALINLNLILLGLLVFLVGRNVVKLVLDRRRRILGSRLRTRLVLAFLGIALMPAILLFTVAQGFVSNSIEDWFNAQVEDALEGSLDVAHSYYEDVAARALGFARGLGDQVEQDELLAHQKQKALTSLLGKRREEYQLDLVETFTPEARVAHSRRDDLDAGLGLSATAALVRRALAGEQATAVDPVGSADVIRAAVPVLSGGKVAGVVVVTSYVPRSVVKRREEIDRSFTEYLRLKIQRGPIRTAYTITLVLVTLVVLFAAIWVGFYVARGITVPIERLAQGTRAVAQGNLDYAITRQGDDEIGTLVDSFNSMTADLKTGRAELDRRRRDLEIVLANIGAGVISADAQGRVVTINQAAEALLGIDAAQSVGRMVDDVFSGEARTRVRPVVSALLGGSRGVGPATVERRIRVGRGGQEVSVVLTATRLPDEESGPQGLVLFLEDVTHLMRIERMEAWREGARRIAHEIKNPLTPIQLAAQRLRRRYAAELRDGAHVLEECTATIIAQVDELKALVDQFSTFARLPTRERSPEDLNRLVEEALVLFRTGYEGIDFEFRPAASLPEVDLDPKAVRRVIVNLLDNAVAACRGGGGDGVRHRITLTTVLDVRRELVRLEVADDGVGMTPEVRERLFEPYFSTKPDGTGLGLAIVSAIVADHNGFVAVHDNVPHGCRFVIEFPVPRTTTQSMAAGGVRI